MDEDIQSKGSVEKIPSKIQKKALIARLRNYGLLFGLIVLVIILSILSPVFLTAGNILDIALQSATNGVIALGMTFVIVTGGIDLSVGSVWALSGITIGVLCKLNIPWPIATLIGILVGALCGAISGALITKGRMQPFIATMGTMSVFRGVALIISGGYTIYNFPKYFQFFGSGKIFIIPMPVIIFLIIFLISYFLFNRCVFGRYLSAIGDNKEAARLCGINVNKNIMQAYIYGGILTAVAAILATARLDAAEPIAGSSAELNAIAAVVIGGTSLAGGEGNIFGTLIGALLIGTVRNGLTLLNVPTFHQITAIGLIIIAAVLIEGVSKTK